MTLATQTAARGRTRLSPVTAKGRVPGDEACRIEIVENPIHHHDPALAADVEERLRRILSDESLGPVAVRFGVCREAGEAPQFICKIENPPRVDTDLLAPWRWWSPLMASADDFSSALAEGLGLRRARLKASAPTA